MSTIQEWAKIELDRIKFGDKDTRAMLDILKLFFHNWDSGASVSVAAPILCRIIEGKPLTPLTGEQDEWADMSDTMNRGAGALYQNIRRSSVFRERLPDGTMIAYDLDLPGDEEFPKAGRITFPHVVA